MIQLIAAHTLEYRDQVVAGGARFAATPIDALLLIHRKRATLPRRRVALPGAAPPLELRAAPLAIVPPAPPAAPVEDEGSPAKPKRRRKPRRDLLADDSCGSLD